MSDDITIDPKQTVTLEQAFEITVKLLKDFQDQLEKSKEREAILIEAVESIKKHQEISLPLDGRMRKLSTIWFIANKSLEKLKTIS